MTSPWSVIRSAHSHDFAVKKKVFSPLSPYNLSVLWWDGFCIDCFWLLDILNLMTATTIDGDDHDKNDDVG